jgi:hypothetical protein
MTTTTLLTKRVDHIMIRAVPSAYDALFSLLTETFQLPVTWPVSNYIPSFRTGGVFCGNCSLEIFQSGPRRTLPSPAPSQAQPYGIAFEPSATIREILAELDQSGIPHTSLLSVPPAEPGALGSMWTLLYLTDLLECSPLAAEPAGVRGGDLVPVFDDAYPNGMVFFCEYNPQFYDTTEGRLNRQAELRARDGGPLGLEGVAEIGVGVKDPMLARQRWQSLFAPEVPVEPDLWRIGDGPAIHLLEHERDGLLYLAWKVANLGHARRFLDAHGMLGAEGRSELRPSLTATFGLDVRLLA